MRLGRLVRIGIVEQEHQMVMDHYDVEPKPANGYQSEAAPSNKGQAQTHNLP